VNRYLRKFVAFIYPPTSMYEEAPDTLLLDQIDDLRDALTEAGQQFRRIRAREKADGLEWATSGPNDDTNAQVIAYHAAERASAALARTATPRESNRAGATP
jgi:hypothetical protein